jgi:hypothetical protein
MPRRKSLVASERIERAIIQLRSHKVLLDHDLAALYAVSTKALNQAVKRNSDRFPADFMFRLSSEETRALNRSQSVTGSQKHRDPRYPPYVFTEQGVAMLSSVLRSKRAVQVNIEIMRTFVRLRHILTTHKDLARKLDALENKYDAQFRAVFDAIRKLMSPDIPPKNRQIGFGKAEHE